MESILKDCKLDLVELKADADNETLTSDILDMQGYDAVAFVAFAKEGNVGSPSVKVQQGAASNMSDAADLAGTATTFTTAADAAATGCVDIIQPRERYVRAVVTIPNWTAVPVGVLAIRYKAKEVPVSNTGELHLSPAEGTA